LVSGAPVLDVVSAAERIAAGELVAFPTETVYGLGARADDAHAVARIYAAKGRPAGHPLIVHVADVQAAQHFAAHWPDSAQRLAAAFWPGPLSLIVARAPGVADAPAAGQPTIGLRCPAHPIAQALLAEARLRGVPGIAAPSANRFGRVSPTRAEHVRAELGEQTAVLDGGACEVGIESAIVDCTRRPARLLRPGGLGRARIEAALGAPLIDSHAGSDADAPRAPGTLAAHYAPDAHVRLMSTAMLRDALQVLGEGFPALAVYSRTLRKAPRGVVLRHMPDQPAAAAHELFTVLRELDAQGARLIWVEQPPDTPDWDGVRDRLQRAAAAAA
jgi:L-threonylcarbamoyladenylate synthase